MTKEGVSLPAKVPYMRVRLALVAERYRAIVEETQHCYLTMREVAALSVSGHTPAETRSKFRRVLGALRQTRKLPRRMAVRLVRSRPGR